MQPIQQEGDELLGVVLLVTREGGCEPRESPFEVGRRVGGRVTVVESGDEVAKGICYLTFHAERVGPVDLVLVHAGCTRPKRKREVSVSAEWKRRR